MILAVPSYSKPKPLAAGCVGVLVNMPDPGYPWRRIRGLMATALYDGESARFVAAPSFPDFGPINPADHLKRVFRIGSGTGAFCQVENDSQRDSNWNGRPALTLARMESDIIAAYRRSKKESI